MNASHILLTLLVSSFHSIRLHQPNPKSSDLFVSFFLPPVLFFFFFPVMHFLKSTYSSSLKGFDGLPRSPADHHPPLISRGSRRQKEREQVDRRRLSAAPRWKNYEQRGRFFTFGKQGLCQIALKTTRKKNNWVRLMFAGTYEQTG